mgnify:CR=1 FL=1
MIHHPSSVVPIEVPPIQIATTSGNSVIQFISVGEPEIKNSFPDVKPEVVDFRDKTQITAEICRRKRTLKPVIEPPKRKRVNHDISWKCQWCQNPFQSRDQLATHILTHSYS